MSLADLILVAAGFAAAFELHRLRRDVNALAALARVVATRIPDREIPPSARRLLDAHSEHEETDR